MKVLLTGFGSSGDIYPFIAVGVALKQRNHEVTFLTNEVFREAVQRNGLDFFQVGTIAEYEWITQNQYLFHSKKAFEFVAEHLIIRYMRPFYNAIALLADETTLIISQSIAPGSRIAFEKLGIPLVTLNLQPFTFWSYVHPPKFPGLSLPEKMPEKIKTILMQNINKHYIDKKFAQGINPFLDELNLPRESDFFSRWMYSPHLVAGAFPEWFAQPAEDWPPNTVLTGFVTLKDNTELPEKVINFLDSDKPVLVFTFGSAMQFAERYFETAVEVTRKLGYRAILITSYPRQINPLLDCDFLVHDFLPYRKLLPQVSAIIHHGGIGTIAHAIAAGTPQLLVPFAHDQPDNADRVKKLGTGIVVKPGNFNVQQVSKKIGFLLNSGAIRENCLKFSLLTDFETSMDKLVTIIERFYNNQKVLFKKEDTFR